MSVDISTNFAEYIKEITPINYNYYEFITNKNKYSKKQIQNKFNKIIYINIDKTWKLSNLNIFKLQYNHFTTEFTYFTNLEKLVINDLVLSKVPDFSVFSKLMYLDLSSTNIGKLIQNKSIKFPKQIKFLSMCNCNLSSIPEEVFNLINLIELYLIDNNITIIPHKIANIKELKFLNLNNNKISIISPSFSKLKKLECLNLNNNPIKIIDFKITKLLALQKLLVNNCNITTIDNSIGNLINLVGLDLANNPFIKSLPLEISKLQKIIEINLDNIGLIEIPYNLFTLTAIEKIKLGNNPFTIIPDSIGNMINLKFLEIYNTNVDYLPEPMGNMKKMEELFIHFNKIKNIPQSFKNLKNLTHLILNDNNITNLSPIFENLTKLQNLNISNNNIQVFPTNIINAKGLLILNYENNPIFTIQPQVKRFIDNIVNGRNFIRDSQNIHNSNVQKNLIKSIEFLTSQKLLIDNLKISHQIINDLILTEDCKYMIEKEFSNIEVHYLLQINFKEIFSYVWTYIHETDFSKEMQNEIKKIINQELLESKELCFIGKITRLVGSLNGFSNIIKITISDSEYISNTISNIKNILNRTNEYTIEKHRQLVTEDLQQYGINDDTITTWIEFIE
jgi:Leucine-rich repeat (LRR) protein